MHIYIYIYTHAYTHTHSMRARNIEKEKAKTRGFRSAGAPRLLLIVSLVVTLLLFVLLIVLLSLLSLFLALSSLLLVFLLLVVIRIIVSIVIPIGWRRSPRCRAVIIPRTHTHTHLARIVKIDHINYTYERFPDHRHRNLKAFREHIRKHVSSCFVTY